MVIHLLHIIESCFVAIASCLQLELFNKSQVLGKA